MPEPIKPKAATKPGNDGQTFIYFGYGSNLLTTRLQQAERAPTAKPLARARLYGHLLKFHKRSRRDGSSKADALWTGAAADVVEGVLFRVEEGDRACLDFAEGAGKGYAALEATVHRVPDDSPVQALVYVATTRPSPERPYDWYVDYVRKGAQEHHLPPEYIDAFIDNVPTKQDLVGWDTPHPCPHRRSA